MRFPAEATSLPVHVLVRDFPETLAVLRRAGVDVTAAGGEPLAAVVDGALLDALAAATAWRAHSVPGPCDRAAEGAAAHALAAATLDRTTD